MCTQVNGETVYQDNTEITFDEEEHRYEVDGLILPSVSEIMRSVSAEHYADIPLIQLERARVRGHKVHEAIELYEKLGIEEEDGEIRPFLLQYKIAKRLEGFRPWKIEVMLTNKRFCGRLDCIGMMGKDLVLIDFKATSTIHTELLELQLAGYQKLVLANHMDPQRCYVLQLKNNGYKFKEVRPNGILWDEIEARYFDGQRQM
jgi:hypothetical protein